MNEKNASKAGARLTGVVVVGSLRTKQARTNREAVDIFGKK